MLTKDPMNEFISSDLFVGRTCGMNQDLLPHIRAIQKSSGSGGDDLLKACREVLKSCEDSDLSVGIIVGVPAGRMYFKEADLAHNDVILVFLLDPLPIDCKQMTLCKGSLPAKAKEHIFASLYKHVFLTL